MINYSKSVKSVANFVATTLATRIRIINNRLRGGVAIILYIRGIYIKSHKVSSVARVVATIMVVTIKGCK